MSDVVTSIVKRAKVLARPILGTVTHVATPDKVAALTFDDGPHPVYTPRLLDVLDRHGARATFFMVGLQAQRHPEIVERVAAAGHAIGNHSWDHPSFAFISSRDRRRQIQTCADTLSPHGARLFRSPGGHQTPGSVLDVRISRHDVIGWGIDPRDYAARSATEISGHVLQELTHGSIVLLHDATFWTPSSDRTPTIQAIDQILGRAADDYTFVTVPELMRRGRPRRINWFWHPATNPFQDRT